MDMSQLYLGQTIGRCPFLVFFWWGWEKWGGWGVSGCVPLWPVVFCSHRLPCFGQLLLSQFSSFLSKSDGRTTGGIMCRKLFALLPILPCSSAWSCSSPLTFSFQLWGIFSLEAISFLPIFPRFFAQLRVTWPHLPLGDGVLCKVFSLPLAGDAF